MNEPSSWIQLANQVGIATNILFGAIQSYGVIKKSNVEKLCEKIINSNIDLTALKEREDLKRYFLSIAEKVASEANIDKIESWKNAILHLVTDFKNFEFKDDFIIILDGLTVQDLTVLYKVYSDDKDLSSLEDFCVPFFTQKGIPRDMVLLSLKKLASYNLISERYGGPTTLGSIQVNLRYVKNDLGPEFLKFISDLKNVSG